LYTVDVTPDKTGADYAQAVGANTSSD